jgi:hypothetical protein
MNRRTNDLGKLILAAAVLNSDATKYLPFWYGRLRIREKLDGV